jgi:hypothetical protein
VDARQAGVDFLTVWRGGEWTLADIVRYQTAASWALLAQAAGDRAEWLRTFVRVQRNGAAGNRAPGREEWPATIVIPAQPARDTAVNAALRILQRGPGRGAPRARPLHRGRRVVPGREPPRVHRRSRTAAFAKTLLEPQRYPNLRDYPGGPPKRPYDVTAHTLPLLYGFAAAFVRDSVAVASDPLPPVRATPWVARGLTGAARRRVALYRSFSPVMDEGWTRWVLDQHRIPYTIVTPVDVRAGRLRGRFDALVVPDQSPRLLAGGPPQRYPDSLRVGLGAEGAAGARGLRGGGRHARDFQRGEPLRDRRPLAPGARRGRGAQAHRVLRAGLALPPRARPTAPARGDVTAPGAGGLVRGGAAVRDHRPRARDRGGPATRDEGDPLLSGWLLGAERVRGAAALVEGAAGARPGGAVRLPPAVSGAEPGYLPPRLERAPRPLAGCDASCLAWAWGARYPPSSGGSARRPTPAPATPTPTDK